MQKIHLYKLHQHLQRIATRQQDSLVANFVTKFPRGVVWYWIGIGFEIGIPSQSNPPVALWCYINQSINVLLSENMLYELGPNLI